jgi:hypothetical protein
MNHAIHTPSGLIGVVRPMKVREETILSDRNLARTGGQIDALLNACWVEVLDPGPYVLGDKPLDWGKVLQCDRFHALLHIRLATYGPNYAFAVPCQACRARIEWELDLSTLPVRTLSDDSRYAFRGGNRFETVLPDAGKKVWFKLLTGDDERKLPQLRKASRDRMFSTLLTYRVHEIEGVDAKEKRAFLEDLTMRDADHLVSEFDRVDGGVEINIEIECPDCYAVQEIELPFGTGFLLPSQQTTRRQGRTASSPS